MNPKPKKPKSPRSPRRIEAKIVLETRPDSHREIKVELPLAEFERFKEQAARQLGEQIKLPGFRQGKVPREALERQIGLRAINDEATQLAINAVLRQVITDHNLKPIGAPQAKIEPVGAGLPPPPRPP